MENKAFGRFLVRFPYFAHQNAACAIPARLNGILVVERVIPILYLFPDFLSYLLMPLFRQRFTFRLCLIAFATVDDAMTSADRTT